MNPAGATSKGGSTRGTTSQFDAMGIAIRVLGSALEVLVVLASDVAYMFTTVGRNLASFAAQVAAFATNHLRVEKNTDGDVTVSSVTKLVGEERIAEMARLLSGLPDSDTGLEHARELVQLASLIE
jgi:hypothetical protein